MIRKLLGGGPPPPPKAVRGTLDRVPCPHCGRHNDFRNLESQNLLDTGHDLECEGCHNLMKVIGVQRITLIMVARAEGGYIPPDHRQEPAAEATTIGYAQLNRLLK